MFDESGTGDAIQAPWGYNCSRAIYTTKGRLVDNEEPTPIIVSFNSEVGQGYSFTKFTVKELSTVDIGGTNYEVYKETLTKNTPDTVIHPFTVVL